MIAPFPKPPHAPKPKIKRLRKRRRMTICIGMLATDGIVLAADSLESGGYLNRSVQKIMTWTVSSADGMPKHPATCMIAGAGDGGFIDAFQMELIADVRGEMTMKEFESHAAAKINDFYSRHVFPFSSLDDGYDFSVLIGATFGPQTRLYRTYKTTLQTVRELTTSIGFGMEYANEIKDYFPFSDVTHTEISAAAIISKTKDCVSGCGKYTDVVSLHNYQVVPDEVSGSRVAPPVHGLINRVPHQKIAQWEASFQNLWKQRQATLYGELVEEELARQYFYT